MSLTRLAPLATLLLLGAAPKPAEKPKAVFIASKPRAVSFATADGWKLAATWRPAQNGRATVILVHGVGASKEEWAPLTDRLAAKGVGTFALDLRGHGASAAGPGGVSGWATFDATGMWTRALEDLRTAAWWLSTQGVPREKVAFGGASIGANLASLASLERDKTPFLLLLSPGDDYRGVRVAARKELKTLAAASLTDQRSLATVKSLEVAAGVKVVTAPRGHGAQMFEDKAVLGKLASWVTEAAK